MRGKIILLSFLVLSLLLNFIYSKEFLLQKVGQNVKIVIPDQSLTPPPPDLFLIYVNDQIWFQSNDFYFHADSKKYSRKDPQLSFLEQSVSKARDDYGFFEKYRVSYRINQDVDSSKSTMTPEVPIFTVEIRFYNEDADNTFIIFEQQFSQLLKGTSINNADLLTTAFPIFQIDDPYSEEAPLPYGFAHWISWIYNSTTTVSDATHRQLLVAPGFDSPLFNKWNSQTTFPGGIGGTGVTTVFDRQAKTAAVLSAFTNPMALSSVCANPGTVEYGIMGNATEIPAGTSISTILYIGQHGVNSAMRSWGATLRKQSNKPDAAAARARDLTLQHLGFTTDNGAFYYYFTDKNNTATYEQTIINIKEYSDKVKIPYKYVLLDSWWYYKGSNGGVAAWEPMTDLFPNGLDYVFNQTGWFIQGHNRYWALDNKYTTSNGGKYNFIEDHVKNGSLPYDPQFWTDLLAKPVNEWGLIVYEQDWLFNEYYQYVSQFLENVNLGREWLDAMAAGADAHKVNIQYCMPFIRHLLQSVAYSAVTQARASDDYVTSPYTGPPNWRIGGQALLIESLGMATSKDGYWSTAFQPGNPYGEERYEACPRLQAAVTILSAGPVAIADGIGYSDVDLIYRSIDVGSGKLLQPSAAATLIDKVFAESAGNSGSAVADIWYAPSDVKAVYSDDIDNQSGSNEEYVRFGSIFAAQLSTPWEIFPSDIDREGKLSVDLEYYVREDNSTTVVQPWSKDHSLTLKACEVNDFQLYSVSPIFRNKWAFLGETAKWVPFSPFRFPALNITPSGIVATAAGSSAETITVTFVNPSKKLVTVTCKISDGKTTVQISSDGFCL